jgi:hypothetical protein
MNAKKALLRRMLRNSERRLERIDALDWSAFSEVDKQHVERLRLNVAMLRRSLDDPEVGA